MSTLHVFGMDLPIIAELSHGYYLVAHKNGPAIANAKLLSSLEPDEEQDWSIPLGIYAEAIRHYVAWSWPSMAVARWPESAGMVHDEMEPDEGASAHNRKWNPRTLTDSLKVTCR